MNLRKEERPSPMNEIIMNKNKKLKKKEYYGFT